MLRIVGGVDRWTGVRHCLSEICCGTEVGWTEIVLVEVGWTEIVLVEVGWTEVGQVWIGLTEVGWKGMLVPGRGRLQT